MAISSAFRGAYENQVAQQNQGISTITSGAKAAGTAIMGTLGFTGAFGDKGMGGLVTDASEHALAGRIGGIGGNIMLAALKEKTESAKQAEKNKGRITIDQAHNALGDNPINRSALKTLDTVFNTLQTAKTEKVKKEKPIETSLGQIDPESDFGKLIKEKLKEEDK